MSRTELSRLEVRFSAGPLALSSICAAILLFATFATHAEEPTAESAPLAPDSVREFFDAAFAVLRNEHELAGAVVSVVQDGEVVFEKGYGYADLEARVPADPDVSLFRIASISKTFVWTAVMQLWERGELDLDADVSTYLDFPIPATFDAPITMAHLLTHTPGFEDRGTGTAARTAEEVRPLGEYLRADMPARVRPPGELAAYSNYGTALAAYVVERVAGVPWQRYIEENILTPLGMTSTTLRQPMPAALEERRARGYTYGGGRFRAQPFEYSHQAPAGIASTTAGDMAMFMMAHLHFGHVGDARILAEPTARKMQTELFRHHPTSNPFLHGFYRSDRNGVVIFGHGGDTNQFHSSMLLFPEHDLGVFVSFNSEPGSAARRAVMRGFVDRFFPADLPPPFEATSGPLALKDYAGEYAALRRGYATFEKLALLVSTFRVGATGDGQLTVSGGGMSRWVPIAPDVFRGLYTDTRLAFRRGPDGRVTHAFFSSSPTTAYDRLRWYQGAVFHGSLFALVGLIAAAAVVGYAWRAVRRAPEGRRLPRLDVVAAWLLSLLQLYFLLRLYQGLTGDTDVFMFGLPPQVARTLTLGTLSCLLAIGVAILAVRQWPLRRGTFGARARYGLVALSGLTMLGLLTYWRLLGFY